MTESRSPFPPFDLETALQKVQAAEDAWNTRNLEKVALAYTEDSVGWLCQGFLAPPCRRGF
jgi:nuclear transport factor 2 (NTF2) superfamily protein